MILMSGESRFVVYCARRPEWQIVCETSDGLRAVEKAAELCPDVVLLDIGMPAVNGIDAVEKIRQISPHAKIVFLSQNSSNEVKQAALATGAEGYVLKLNAASKLIPAIAAALRDGHRSAQQSAALPRP
jgi:DNA-binding NarL/FixJ family response regulator